MELRHLRYFLAVADAAHFGRAARRLHVSQPTLSQQVRALEDELGAALFERLRSGIRLTQEGELFRGYASRALEDVRAGAGAVAALRGLATGALRVGYPPSLRGIVLPALTAVLKRHPRLALVAEEGVVQRVERRLVDGRLDIAVAYAPARRDEVETEALFDSRLGLVVPRDHALAGARAVGPRQLAGEPFALLSPGLRGRARADAYLAATRFSPRVVFESNAVGAVLGVVRAGLAVAVLPVTRFAAAERVAVLALTPAPRADLVALFFRKGAPRAPAAVEFAAEMRAQR